MEEYSKFSVEEDLRQFKINERRIFFALKLSFFEDILGYSLIFPLLSPVARSLGSSDFFIGVMIATNALATLLFSPMWGKLSDKFGRKPFLIDSQFGTLAAFTLFAFSNSLEMIFFTSINPYLEFFRNFHLFCHTTSISRVIFYPSSVCIRLYFLIKHIDDCFED